MTRAPRDHLPLDHLARAVHAHWRDARLKAGWREGVYDRAARTSPYLKPYDQFDDVAIRRELWLTLGDVLSVAKACAAHGGRFDVHPGKLVAGVNALRHALDGAAPIRAAAADVHRCWRVINRHFDLGGADPRADTTFEALAPEDQTVTIANLRADMAAIGEVFAPRMDASCCAVMLDARMMQDEDLMRHFEGEALR